jgi:hypothetical protein
MTSYARLRANNAPMRKVLNARLVFYGFTNDGSAMLTLSCGHIKRVKKSDWMRNKTGYARCIECLDREGRGGKRE